MVHFVPEQIPFYRATHMRSAVYDVVQCLSVRLSVTLVYCVETTEHIIKQLAIGVICRGYDGYWYLHFLEREVPYPPLFRTKR